jgi:hypothetical protein
VQRHKGLFYFLVIYGAVQALLGFLAVQFSFSRCQRMLKIEEERDSKFPAFRRLDVHKWSKWKFLPGAMLLMPTRLVLLILTAGLCALIST